MAPFLLALALAAGACTSSAPPSVSSASASASAQPVPYLATVRHNPGMIAGVGLGGTLVERNGCIVLVRTSDRSLAQSRAWLVIFEAGYHLARATDGHLIVVDADGRYLWRVGDPFTEQFGGSTVSEGGDAQARALASTTEPVPSTCTYSRVLATNADVYRPPGGPPTQLPTPIPSLLGMTRSDAAKAAAAAGFNVVFGKRPSSQTPGTVVREHPLAGTMAWAGTKISMQLAEPTMGPVDAKTAVVRPGETRTFAPGVLHHGDQIACSGHGAARVPQQGGVGNSSGLSVAIKPDGSVVARCSAVPAGNA